MRIRRHVPHHSADFEIRSTVSPDRSSQRILISEQAPGQFFRDDSAVGTGQRRLFIAFDEGEREYVEKTAICKKYIPHPERCVLFRLEKTGIGPDYLCHLFDLRKQNKHH